MRSARYLLLLAFSCLAACAAAAQTATPPDAVIELWEQSWTVSTDGSLTYQEKQHVRLNNERANGEFADPRITFNRDTQKVEIVTARTRLPDGRTLVYDGELSGAQVAGLHINFRTEYPGLPPL